MTRAQITLYLRHALQVILYALLFTPLLISSKYLFPFITTKTMFFRILVELAVLIYVALALTSEKYRPKMTPLSWAVVIFGGLIFFTGITGVDFYKSFWGTIERGEGFLTLAHLIIYFLLLVWTFKDKKDWLYYLAGLSLVGFFVNLYGLLQRLNVEHFFLFGNIIHSGEGRLSATLGNAAFMGAFTLAQFFICLILFLQKKEWWWRLIFIIFGLLDFFILFQTQTRGALLALFAVSLLISGFYALKGFDKKRRIIGASILALVVFIAGFIFLNRDSDWVKNNSTLNRLVNISAKDITTESRMLAWDTSWKGWKDRFLFGYGWENYNVAFNKYFHAEIFKDSGSQLWFDRAHNTIFDVAVATGIFGLISYLSIFGLALYLLLKNKNKNFDLYLLIAGLLLAHFLQNIFVFDVLSTYIILFVILAIVSFLTEGQNDLSKTPNRTIKNFNWIIFVIATILITSAAYVFNFKPMKANALGIKAMIANNSAQFNEAIEIFNQAIALGTYQTMEIRQKMADNTVVYAKPQNMSQGDMFNNLQAAATQIKNNITEHPFDVQNYLYLMVINNRLGLFDHKFYDEVIELGNKALTLSPTRPQIYFELGQAKISLGLSQDGINYFKTALAQYPDAVESHWNLMAAYIIAKQDKLADEEYNYLVSHNYNFNNTDTLNRLINTYLVADNKEKIAIILEKLVTIEPTGSNYARLAAAYRDLGKKDLARQAVQKAVALEPSLQAEAQKFLDLLNQ